MQESTNSTMQRRNLSPEEIMSMDIGRPMTRSMFKKLQNANSNPGERNPGPGVGTPSGAVGHNARNAQRNPNPRQKNPGPSKGTWHYQANANFRTNDGRPPCNDKEEIASLKAQLQQSLLMQQTSHHKMVAANHKAANYKAQLDWVKLQLKCCRENAENTIQVLQAQLEEARRNRPESYTEENFRAQLSEAPAEGPGKTPITGAPDETCDALEELSSHHAAELCVEASPQTMEAPQTDSVELKAARAAALESLCKRQQEQINQLQEQLLKAQRQREEEAPKHKEEEERARCEAVLEENNQNQEEKEPDVTILDGPETQSKTLRETVESHQEKEAGVKLQGPEEIPKKKKKKRGWLRRLFTCVSAASS